MILSFDTNTFQSMDHYVNHHTDKLRAVLFSVEKKLQEIKEDNDPEAKECQQELEIMRHELRNEEEFMWEQLAALVGYSPVFVRSYIEIRHPHMLAVSDNPSIIDHLMKEIEYIDARRKELIVALQKELEKQDQEINTQDVYRVFSADTTLHSLIDGVATLYERAKKEDYALWAHVKKQLDLLLRENVLFFLGTGHVPKAVTAWKRLSEEKRNHEEAARIIKTLFEDHEECGAESDVQKHAALTELAARFYDQIRAH